MSRAAEQRAKDSAMAAHLKERGVKRTTGACPWGCGTGILNGGKVLSVHLNTCLGPMKTRIYRTR